jgi:hypothetical protein
MAIDQRDVSSTLRFMDDRALQQYAAMHKNDPYIFPLAFQESQNRQKLRMQQQAQAGAQPQPKVAEQALAQMAPPQPQPMPEAQGIGALAAPNMQGMADGGIAGYDDANFAERSEPVIRMAEGGVARYDFGGVTYADWAQGEARRRRALLDAERERNMREIAAGQTYVPSDNPAAAFSDPRLLGPTPAAETVGYTPPKVESVKPKTDAASKQLRTTDTAQTGTGAPAKVTTAEQAKAQAKDFVDYGDATKELEKARSGQELQGEKLRTMLAESLPKTPALQGLEQLLDKQDAQTGGEKDKEAGLALLSAGLAIAGGSSRYALQNLREAVPAVAQYSAALKDMKKMERENMKMRGEIEQARRAEARDDTKLKLQLEEKIGDRQDKINELGIGLTSKIANTTAEVASKIWSTSFEAQNRKEVAGITANAQANSQLNMFKQLGSAPEGSPLQKGFQMYKQEGAEPKMYADYVKMSSDPLTSDAFLKKYPTFEVYKSGMGGGMQFAPPPANATVLSKPKS